MKKTIRLNKTILYLGISAVLQISALVRAHAQVQDESPLQLRHIAGIRTLDFTGGWGKGSLNGEFACSKFLSNVCFLSTGFDFEKTEFPSIRLSDFSLRESFHLMLFKPGPNFYVNGAAGIFAGIESNTAYSPPDDVTFSYPCSDIFIYGAFAGAEAELYLNGNVALVFGVQQWYLMGSVFGNWKYQCNGGFCFVLN